MQWLRTHIALGLVFMYSFNVLVNLLPVLLEEVASVHFEKRCVRSEMQKQLAVESAWEDTTIQVDLENWLQSITLILCNLKDLQKAVNAIAPFVFAKQPLIKSLYLHGLTPLAFREIVPPPPKF
ncbi:hypothetical protein AAG747_10975 [Rapidithrix thailandica]|uniref:Uncharacterized protein n=1 Tax=Rapidithrix thailandica TaxID=413964 RepID=A0AAW9S7S5_9BACT